METSNKQSTNFSLMLVFLIACFLPLAVDANTTGFIENTISLEPSSFVEGDEVRMSVSFQNIEEKTLTGEIHFYNDDELLASRELTLAGGQTGEFVALWDATLGEHYFYASAEKLRLEGSIVTILGPKTDPLVVKVGFTNSSIAEKLRSQGGFGAVVAGFVDEVSQFFNPIIQSIDSWRLSKLPALEATKERIEGDKESAEKKVKAILTLHSIVVFASLFVLGSQVLFWVIFCLVLIWLLIRVVKLFRRIIRGRYEDE